MGDGVDPRKEDDGPCRRDVEGDVLVELDDAVERRLSGQRDESPADGEEDEGDVDMKNQGGRTGYRKRRAERVSCYLEVVLDCEVYEGEAED